MEYDSDSFTRDENNNDIEIEGGSLNGDQRKKYDGFGPETPDHGKEFSMMVREPLLLRNRTNTTSQIAIVGANTCPIESLDYEYVAPFLILFCFLLFISLFMNKFCVVFDMLEYGGKSFERWEILVLFCKVDMRKFVSPAYESLAHFLI